MTFSPYPMDFGALDDFEIFYKAEVFHRCNEIWMHNENLLIWQNFTSILKYQIFHSKQKLYFLRKNGHSESLRNLKVNLCDILRGLIIQRMWDRLE